MTNGPAQILVLHFHIADPCVRERAAVACAGAMRMSTHHCPLRPWYDQFQAIPGISNSSLGLFSSILSLIPQSHLSLVPLHPKTTTCPSQKCTPFCPTAPSLLPKIYSCLSCFVRVWDTTVEKGSDISAILYSSSSEHTYLFTFLFDSFPNFPEDKADCLSKRSSPCSAFYCFFYQLIQKGGKEFSPPYLSANPESKIN